MNCVLYARVSTDKQAEKDLSIPAQLRLMREHAHREGWTVVEEFIEPGETATNLTGRPVLQQVLSRVQDGTLGIDTVIAHKLNRMARSLDDYIPLRALLAKHGVRLSYVVERVDNTPSGRLLENIMASMAEYESANLSEETKKGMRQRVLTGGWPHQTPRGYITVKATPHSRVEVHPRIGPLMKRAFELYSSGWYSMDTVARLLAKDGLVTSSGRPISKSNMHRLLTNPFYVGRLRWKDLEVEGGHPPLIPVELFEKVQAVIRERFRQPGIRRRTQGLPLRGLAICAFCRGNISGEWHRKWAYYRCSRQSYRRELCKAKLCSAKRAHADLERICLQTQITRAVAERIQKAAARLIAERTNRHDIRRLEAEEGVLVERGMLLTTAFAAGEMTGEDYRRKVEELRVGRLRHEAAMVVISVDPKILMSKVVERLQIATTLWDLYQQFDDDRRIQLLRTVFSSVVLSGDGIVGFALKPPFDKLSGRTKLQVDRASDDNAAEAMLDEA